MNNESIFLGYTDEQLKQKVSARNVNKGATSWLYWTSELYSVGRLYRKLAYYPRFLPLFFYSDHGIHRPSRLTLHEKENNSNVHFTFNPERALNSSSEDKEVVLISHPWIEYRRKKNYKPSSSAKGTLIFISHSSSAVEYKDKNREQYFADLKKLPEKYKPLVLCMHMHDINKNHHLNYRKYGFPIITIGNTSSVNFVDEFYKATTQFKYASSNSPGTQLYFCIEMGMPYFIFGETPDLINHSDPNLPTGVYKPVDKVEKQILKIEFSLFRNLVDSVSLEQKIFVEWMLGLTANKSQLALAFIIWRELFRNGDKLLKLILTRIISKSRRNYELYFKNTLK